MVGAVSALLAFGEPMLSIDGCLATGARGSDGLAVHMIGDIARCEDSLNHRGGRAVALQDDVSGFVQIEVTIEDLSVGAVADGNEVAVGGQVFDFVGHNAADPDARHFFITEDFLDNRVPENFDLLVLEDPPGHDGRGPELITPVNDRHLRGELREKEGLLHCRVAATDHHEFLVAEEEPVARCAS